MKIFEYFCDKSFVVEDISFCDKTFAVGDVSGTDWVEDLSVVVEVDSNFAGVVVSFCDKICDLISSG